jgi:hypothetical protein
MNVKCAVCHQPDRARLIELGWNAKMNAAQIAAVFGNIPSAAAITKHLQEHLGDGYASRDIPVPDARSMRERVTTLQQTMVEEVERRIRLAQEAAARYNRDIAVPEETELRDWSWYFNILDKDIQASIGSILKMQGLTDKREIGKAAIGLDVAKLMLGGGDGLAPKRLTAGKDDEIEGVFKEIDANGGSTE